MIRGMTPPLPLPVRVAAGLVATVVEQARDLPRLALELPVTAVSQALQASMRVQQKVTELAIKGDRVLGWGRRSRTSRAWATFDDDAPRGATVAPGTRRRRSPRCGRSTCSPRPARSNRRRSPEPAAPAAGCDDTTGTVARPR